jgi:hypothetical protein
VERRIQYRLASVVDYRLQPLLTRQERQHYLQLPGWGNERSRALASHWWQQSGGEPERFIRLLLEHFQRGFEYTLAPGALGHTGTGGHRLSGGGVEPLRKLPAAAPA